MHDNTSKINVLVMRALEQRGHMDQLTTHFMISYDGSTEQHGKKRSETDDWESPLLGLSVEAHFITTYCLHDNDYKGFICSIKYDKHSIQSLPHVR